MSPVRIVEWSQSVYADMAEKCWTIVDSDGRDVAGTFWTRKEVDDAYEAMTRPWDSLARTMEERELLEQANPTIRHPEGF